MTKHDTEIKKSYLGGKLAWPLASSALEEKPQQKDAKRIIVACLLCLPLNLE